MKPVLHVAFGIDDHYVSRMGATIASIVENNPHSAFVFHVFTFPLSDDNMRRLREVETLFGVEVAIHVIDKSRFSQFEHFIKSSYYSSSTFSRLIMPDMVAGTTERLLYLDADVLCFGDLQPLFNVDLEGKVAAVIQDAPVTVARRTRALRMESGRYFNAGVMLIDVPAWIAAGISQQAVDVLLGDYKDLRFSDQDALNIVLEHRARYVSVKWNYLFGLVGELEKGRRTLAFRGQPALVHFAGSVKPWAEWTGHEAVGVYRHFHQACPWGDLPLDSQPRNYKEMRMQSRFLFHRWQFLHALAWYGRYLVRRHRHLAARRS